MSDAGAGAVLVTGATGTVGSSVVAELRARGVPVIAAVRDPSTSAARALEVPLRQFDFDGSTSRAAELMEGVDRLFLLRPPPIADVATFLSEPGHLARPTRSRVSSPWAIAASRRSSAT